MPFPRSSLEPGQQLPEGVGSRWQIRRHATARPQFRPADVRAQPPADPPPGRVGRLDERDLESEVPGSGLLLEPAARAAVADEVADLVQCDEVAHLTAHVWTVDLESPLDAAVAMLDADDNGPTAAAVGPADAVALAEVGDVTVEVGWPQTPLLQVSPLVHRLPSLHRLPLLTAVPVHCPTLPQVSPVVQELPSSQGAPWPTYWQLNLQQLCS